MRKKGRGAEGPGAPAYKLSSHAGARPLSHPTSPSSPEEEAIAVLQHGQDLAQQSLEVVHLGECSLCHSQQGRWQGQSFRGLSHLCPPSLPSSFPYLLAMLCTPLTYLFSPSFIHQSTGSTSRLQDRHRDDTDGRNICPHPKNFQSGSETKHRTAEDPHAGRM